MMTLEKNIFLNLRKDLITVDPTYISKTCIRCPLCLADKEFYELDLEHILGQNTVKNDNKGLLPNGSTINKRTKNTLLCKNIQSNKPTSKTDKTLTSRGCNSWKGSHYDNLIYDMINNGPVKIRQLMNISNLSYYKYNIAAMILAYLAAFERFGYQIIYNNREFVDKLINQFNKPADIFEMEGWIIGSLLVGQQVGINYKNWDNPFHFSVSKPSNHLIITMRNFGTVLPLHDISEFKNSKPIYNRFRIQLLNSTSYSTDYFSMQISIAAWMILKLTQ